MFYFGRREEDMAEMSSSDYRWMFSTLSKSQLKTRFWISLEYACRKQIYLHVHTDCFESGKQGPAMSVGFQQEMLRWMIESISIKQFVCISAILFSFSVILNEVSRSSIWRSNCLTGLQCLCQCVSIGCWIWSAAENQSYRL